MDDRHFEDLVRAVTITEGTRRRLLRLIPATAVAAIPWMAPHRGEAKRCRRVGKTCNAKTGEDAKRCCANAKCGAAGRCRCKDGYAACEQRGRCIRLDGNAHCGRCGQAYVDGATCQGPTCICPDGRPMCPGSGCCAADEWCWPVITRDDKNPIGVCALRNAPA